LVRGATAHKDEGSGKDPSISEKSTKRDCRPSAESELEVARKSTQR
jgi:hypothetical protein